MKRARRPSSSGCSESRSELANHKERKERKEGNSPADREIRNPKPETDATTQQADRNIKDRKMRREAPFFCPKCFCQCSLSVFICVHLWFSSSLRFSAALCVSALNQSPRGFKGLDPVGK